MVPQNKQQCANPVCSCTVSSGEYCSPECQSAEDSRSDNSTCKCGHDDCRAKTHHAKAH